MSNIRVNVNIANSEPPYEVTLTPPGPYRITERRSTVTMKLDQKSAQAGFRMFGIGYPEPATQEQLSAVVNTDRNPDDTLTVTDAKTKNGRFEFVMLYQDQNGGAMVYGLDPVIENED